MTEVKTCQFCGGEIIWVNGSISVPCANCEKDSLYAENPNEPLCESCYTSLIEHPSGD